MLCCSWSRSFLMPIPCRSASGRCSFRRALRLLRAARSRWPDGRLVRDGIGLHWMVPRGVGGADLSGAMVWLPEPPAPPPGVVPAFRLVRQYPDPNGPEEGAVMDALIHEAVVDCFRDGSSLDEVRALIYLVRADNDLGLPVWRLELLN